MSVAALGLLALSAMVQEMPAPLDAALSQAEAQPDLRVSYTMRFEWPGEAPVVQRFDAAERRWTTIEGDAERLPDDAQDKLGNVMKSESVPGGLLYADFRKHLRDVQPVEETEDRLVYSFIPPEAEDRDVGAEAEAAVRARLYVAKDGGRLARYEVRGLKPFKPLPVARMEEFVVEQDFERLGEDGPALLTRLYSRQKGERFFRKVDTEFTATFSDFEIVQ
jgi:hypothetical protein